MDNMSLMVPGVVNTHTFMSNTNGISYSVNGQRGRSNNSEIDGQTNNDTSIGGPSFFFDNQDAIQEVQVLTTSMGAQYGHTMGATVNYITKSGTNTFHGSGFEIYTGSWLSFLMQYQKDPNFGGCAGTPGCSISPPKFVQNNWGGTLGGPIWKNRLWGFGSTIWSHTYEGGVVLTSQGGLFPDPNGLSTLTSSFPSNPAVAALTLNGPYSTKVGNPQPLADSVTTVPVTDGTTTANVEVAGYERTFPNTIFDQEHLGRLDFQATANDRIYLRYNYQNNPYNPAFYLVSAATAAGGGYPNVYPISHEVGGDLDSHLHAKHVESIPLPFQQSSIGFYGGAIPTSPSPTSAHAPRPSNPAAPLRPMATAQVFPRPVLSSRWISSRTTPPGTRAARDNIWREFDSRRSQWVSCPIPRGHSTSHQVRRGRCGTRRQSRSRQRAHRHAGRSCSSLAGAGKSQHSLQGEGFCGLLRGDLEADVESHRDSWRALRVLRAKRQFPAR